MPSRISFIFAIVCFLSAIALAEDSIPSIGTKQKVRVKLLPNGYYRPETRIAVGAFALFTFKPNLSDTISRWSYWKSTFVVTQNRQLAFENDWLVFFKKEKVSFYGAMDIMQFPEFFYGIGDNTNKDSAEFYQLNRVVQNSLLLRKINGFYFAGLNFDTQYLFGYNPDRAIERHSSALGTRGYFSNGIGPTFLVDSRDNGLMPKKGWYNEVTINVHHKYTLSDYHFTNVILNSRKFITVFKKCIWATEGYFNFNAGDVPFRSNPAVGGMRFLRGYYTGRFRDKNLVVLQSEIRIPVVWRIGVVGFAGMGSLAPDLKSFQLSHVKYTAGAGLRFILSKRDNASVRFDYGFTKEGGGFYIVFGEAF